MGHVNPHALATPEHGTGADASGSRRSTKEYWRKVTCGADYKQGRMDFSFSFWIVLCTQVLNNHQFDHSIKSIIELLLLTQQHIELIHNTIPVRLAQLYLGWHVGP